MPAARTLMPMALALMPVARILMPVVLALMPMALALMPVDLTPPRPGHAASSLSHKDTSGHCEGNHCQHHNCRPRSDQDLSRKRQPRLFSRWSISRGSAFFRYLRSDIISRLFLHILRRQRHIRASHILSFVEVCYLSLSFPFISDRYLTLER